MGIVIVSIGGSIYLLGFLLWGYNVFEPFLAHFTRDPAGYSIFIFINEAFGLDLSKYIIYFMIFGVFILIVFLYFKNDDISTYSLILIICFILVLPTFYPQYVLWFFPLLAYWSIKHNYALKRTILLYFLVMILIWTWIFAFDFFGFPDIPYISIISFTISIIFVIMIYLEYRKKNLIVIES
ncbi:MAG: hypothetical protein ACFFD2_10315 [Promethearchaeota archaeon]